MRYSPILLGLLACLAPNTGAGQASRKSASELLAFLTYQSNRPGKLREEMGVFGCGVVPENQAAAKKLVKLGSAALPALEQALASIEESGERSKFVLNAGWWLTAYAGIEGPRSYLSLQRLLNDPKLEFLHPNLEIPIAVSLSLTSYVSGSWGPGRVFRCSEQQPRDALNLLIMAWQKGDQHWVQASLGPDARSALDELLKNKPWTELRASLWPRRSNGNIAVGYRFSGPREWSEPTDFIEDVPPPQVDATPDSFTLDTRFTNYAGKECGRFQVRFIHTRRGVGPADLEFRIDTPDIDALLHVISACAVQNSNAI